VPYSLETRRRLDVDVNLVPFLDVMSCLAAFLLASVAWVHTAALDVTPTIKGSGEEPDVITCYGARLSVFVEHDAIWIGMSRVNELEEIRRTATGHDWEQLRSRLRAHKAAAWFADTEDLDFAVESLPGRVVPYQEMTTAIDVIVAAGFRDVRVTTRALLLTAPAR
jgi:biopolymer transport protein ExbD